MAEWSVRSEMIPHSKKASGGEACEEKNQVIGVRVVFNGDR